MAGGARTIPAILHQSWRTDETPSELDEYRASARRHHPDWQHRLWADADNRALIAERYPWFLDTYDGFDAPIKRADCARYFVLHAFGGVYADLDMEFLHPIDAVLAGHALVLCDEPRLHAERMGTRVRGLTRIVSNALMASAAGHPFWEHLFPCIERCRRARDPLDATGPFVLTAAVESYAGPDPAHIEPPERFMPRVDPRSPDEFVLRWRPELGRAVEATIAIHHWAGSWIDRPKREHKLQRMRRRWNRKRLRREQRRARAAWFDVMTRESQAWFARPPGDVYPPRGHEPDPTRSSAALPTVTVLTPARSVASQVPRFFTLLERLTYPPDRLGLVVVEGDSDDGTRAAIEAGRSRFAGWRRFEVHTRDFAFYPDDTRRWHPAIQLERRGVIAAVRNELVDHALRVPTDYCLWIDADVAAYPVDIIEQLLAAKQRVVTPHCVMFPGGPTFDLNAYIRDLPFEPHKLEKETHDGLLQPDPRARGRLYMEDVRYRDKVRLDAVGGTMLLVETALHRAGAIFPESPYDLLIETEGFARQVQHMGAACWGLPNVEIMHPLG